MPDTKLSEITEEVAEFQEDDRLYVVQEDGSPAAPVSKYTTFGTLRDAILSGSTEIDPLTFGLTLTLAQGRPEGPQLRPVTPSSWDTGAETCTLPSGHGLLSGARASVSATANGLTVSTLYYLHISGNTCSFHTTHADSLTGSSKVNITGTTTIAVVPSGMEATGTIYLEPDASDRVALWNGTAWEILDSGDAAISVTLPSLASGEQRDLWLKITTGAIDYEWSAAWTDANNRAQAIAKKNGVWVKSGNPLLRYAGTIRAFDTDKIIDDMGGIANKVGGRRHVFNAHNRRVKLMELWYENAFATYTYNNSAVRRINGTSGSDNILEFLCGVVEDDLPVLQSVQAHSAGSLYCGANINSTAAIRSRQAPDGGVGHAHGNDSGSVFKPADHSSVQLPVVGLNTVYFLEQVFSGTATIRPWECQFSARFRM